MSQCNLQRSYPVMYCTLLSFADTGQCYLALHQTCLHRILLHHAILYCCHYVVLHSGCKGFFSRCSPGLPLLPALLRCISLGSRLVYMEHCYRQWHSETSKLVYIASLCYPVLHVAILCLLCWCQLLHCVELQSIAILYYTLPSSAAAASCQLPILAAATDANPYVSCHAIHVCCYAS